METMETVEIMEKLRRVEIDILNEVVRICDKYNLSYFLIGGTLLGAIRHKGFIPWDDDLDIAMPRYDYNKLIEICKTELNEKYYLHSISTDDNYWLPFIKIRKHNTIFEEAIISHIDAPKGIYIDIFPLDNVFFERNLFQSIRIEFVKIINTIIIRKRKIIIDNNQNKASLKFKLIEMLFKKASIKQTTYFRDWLLSFGSNNKNSKFYINAGSNYNYIKQTASKSKYEPPTEVEFEGKMYKAPADWDYILKRIYGDYMKLPPIEKRITHKPLKILFGDELHG